MTMDKYRSIIIMMVILCSGLSLQAQVISRWFGTSNELWSVAENWQSGIPGIPEGTTTNIAQFGTALDHLTVDVPTPGVIRFNFQNNAKAHAIDGGPIDIYPGNLVAIENNSQGNTQTFNNDITLHYDAGDDAVQLNNTGDGPLVFNGFVNCTSNDALVLKGQVTLNGGVSVTNLQCTDTAIFSNGVDNAISGGFYLTLANANATVDTLSGTVFYDGPRLWFNNDNTRLMLNSSHVLGDETELFNGASGRNCYVAFNGDETMGELAAVGRFYFEIGDDVAALAFQDSHGRSWTDGVVISNFHPEVISFGTNSAGLRTDQLDLIEAYDYTGMLVTNLSIDASGFLTGDVTPPPPPPTVSADPIGDITIEILPGGTNLTVTWNTTNGATYAVESTPDLMFEGWTDVVTNLVGTGGELIVTDAVGNAESFYRVYSNE